MRINILLGLAATLLLAGCNTTKQLDSAGQKVTFTEDQPAKNCQFIGTATGSQSNWFSGASSDSNSLRGAANDLRNQAARMGGNVIYGTNSPSETFWSNFAPLDSKMAGQVYKCQ